MKTAFAFDFDGTITNVPGEYSDIYSQGWSHRELEPHDVYSKMVNVMDEYLPPQTVNRIRNFFDVLCSQTHSVITIHTNNYSNVVKACLFNHIGIPEHYIDIERSSFRESLVTKLESLDHLTNDPKIGIVYYFDETKSYIKKASALPKVRTVNCQNGDCSISKLLEETPVNDKKSLNKFLDKYSC